MKFIFKILSVLLITQIYFLDVIGCGSTSKRFQVASYDGQTYEIVINQKSGRYTDISSMVKNYKSLDGHTFIGWGVVPLSYKEKINTLSDLENCEVVDVLIEAPHMNLDEAIYYPILVKDDLVDEFYQNSPLTIIQIHFIRIVNGVSEDRVYLEARLNQSIEEVINEYLDIEIFELYGLTNRHISPNAVGTSSGEYVNSKIELTDKISSLEVIYIYAYYK